jgi:ATP-dependent Clp protease ATP-binding subunit ClpC
MPRLTAIMSSPGRSGDAGVFERYTERARRVLFFARYEATHLGGLAIETEHLLLGLVREGKGLTRDVFERSQLSRATVRQEIDARVPVREKVSTSVELPFSEDTRRVLRFAAEEAERLRHRHIGPEHLLVGILRESGCLGATLLIEKGVQLDTVREEIIRVVEGDERSS